MMTRRRHPLLQGRTAMEQSPPAEKARPDRAAREAMKQDRARDAALAMQEYESGKRAVVANAERLRALRLAKAAGGETPAEPQKPLKPKKPARKKH